MTDRLESLRSLQDRVDARAESRVRSDGWAAHEAVLDRLAANVRVAQIRGWTSCAIEHVMVAHALVRGACRPISMSGIRYRTGRWNERRETNITVANSTAVSR